MLKQEKEKKSKEKNKKKINYIQRTDRPIIKLLKKKKESTRQWNNILHGLEEINFKNNLEFYTQQNSSKMRVK